MERGRAYTRFQREKFWKRAYNYWKNRVYFKRNESEELIVKLAYKHYKNRKKCSCFICSPKRELLGPTVQEIKQPPFIPEEDLDELDSDKTR